MKKLLFLLAIGGSIVMASCVSKQKYMDSQDQLSNCTKERKALQTKVLNLENTNKDLSADNAGMKQRLMRLEKDTLTYGHRYAELSRDYNNLKKSFNDLTESYKKLDATNKKESAIILKNIQDLQLSLENKEKELSQKEARFRDLSDSLQVMSDSLTQKSIDLERQQKRLAELQAILDKKDEDVKALKEKIKQALQGFDGSGLTVFEKNGKVYVSMEEKLLFASGSFQIDQRGQEALKKLAGVLAMDPDINISIEGHTDNVPFKGASTAQIKDNWDLSVMRATTVVKTLLASGNIDPQRLTACGKGEYVPLDNADTKEARAKNRRTEIILTPKLDALFEILE
ncbi:MAG: OmpA family protein [Bacteroidales bacterium]|nr:OmpA family protein [Bacteroidales bacterium]